MPEVSEEVQTSEVNEPVQTSEPIEPVKPSDPLEGPHPLTVLHEATEAAQNSYNETVAQAKQDRDEAIASAQKQYELSLKAYNAAVEVASRRGY